VAVLGVTAGVLTKTATAVRDPAVAVLDGLQGRVVGVAAVTAIEDLHGEVLVPGAFANTLAVRRAVPVKLLVDHDQRTWGMASIDLIEELHPSDPRVPAELQALGAGALVFEATFDMENPDAAATFRRIRTEAKASSGQWSVGYRVLRDRELGGVRYLDELDLLEVSAVGFGAAPNTMTIEAKAFGSRRGVADALVLAAEVNARRRRELITSALLAG
jgi:phage head maturation protease